MGTSSQFFGEINSIFDSQKEHDLNETAKTYCTRSSSHKRTTSINLGGNQSDDAPATAGPSMSPPNNDQREIAAPGKLL